MILIEQREIGRPIPGPECGIFDPGRFELSGGLVHGGDYLGSRIVGRISRLKSCFEFFETISQLRHDTAYPPDSKIRGIMMLPTKLRFNVQANCQRMSGAQVEHQNPLSPFRLIVTLLRQVSSEEYCATCVPPWRSSRKHLSSSNSRTMIGVPRLHTAGLRVVPDGSPIFPT